MRITTQKKDGWVYFYYSTLEAYELFSTSKQTLIDSDNIDYMVDKFRVGQSNAPKILSDTFVIEKCIWINEGTYKNLHLSLCSKIKRLKIDPEREEYLKKIERRKNTGI